jgi:hypothetical protein
VGNVVNRGSVVNGGNEWRDAYYASVEGNRGKWRIIDKKKGKSYLLFD